MAESRKEERGPVYEAEPLRKRTGAQPTEKTGPRADEASISIVPRNGILNYGSRTFTLSALASSQNICGGNVTGHD